jgi:hypothetical protein
VDEDPDEAGALLDFHITNPSAGTGRGGRKKTGALMTVSCKSKCSSPLSLCPVKFLAKIKIEIRVNFFSYSQAPPELFMVYDRQVLCLGPRKSQPVYLTQLAAWVGVFREAWVC